MVRTNDLKLQMKSYIQTLTALLKPVPLRSGSNPICVAGAFVLCIFNFNLKMYIVNATTFDDRILCVLF